MAGDEALKYEKYEHALELYHLSKVIWCVMLKPCMHHPEDKDINLLWSGSPLHSPRFGGGDTQQSFIWGGPPP